MNTEKMSVHRALAELKTIDARIAKKIRESTFCATNKHSNKKIDGLTIEDYKARMRDDFKSVQALINRREAMKRAVVLSNAVTEVEIGGRKYTVAEAIEMRNSGIENKNCLLSNLKAQYSAAKRVLETQNGEALEEKANRYVEGLYGGKDSSDKSDDVNAAYKAYIENNSYDMVDPNNIHERIQELEEEIEKFRADVDAALSCSNAITEIEFSYEVE